MIQQTKLDGACEVCDASGIKITLCFGNIWMCDICKQKEEDLQKANTTPEAQIQRVDSVNATIKLAKQVDNSIEVRTDIFNAATVAINELKNAIDSDSSIQNKPAALAEVLYNRIKSLQSAAFEMNEKLIENNNNQKAIQVYMNNLANSLRVEEREKWKIENINYKPNPVKQPKVKSITTKKVTKIDKVALKKHASELGISEFVLQSFVIQMGESVEEAAAKIRKSIEQARAATK